VWSIPRSNVCFTTRSIEVSRMGIHSIYFLDPLSRWPSALHNSQKWLRLLIDIDQYNNIFGSISHLCQQFNKPWQFCNSSTGSPISATSSTIVFCNLLLSPRSSKLEVLVACIWDGVTGLIRTDPVARIMASCFATLSSPSVAELLKFIWGFVL